MGWLAITMDKTALARLVRVDWDTTGRIIERVVADRLDPNRLQRLFQVGVDEASWRKGHSYLTLVSNHATGKFVWGRAGKDAATLDHFFDDLGLDRAEAIQAVSMDMSPAFRKSVTTHAGNAVICYDPFHGDVRVMWGYVAKNLVTSAADNSSHRPTSPPRKTLSTNGPTQWQ